MPETTQLRIAVSGVGGEAGQGIVSALRAHTEPVFVVGFDHQVDCPGFYMVDAHETVPDCTSEDFVPVLITFLKKHEVSLYFCGVDLEVVILSETREAIVRESGCRVIMPPPELVRAATDKLLTARWLERHKLSYPTTEDSGHVLAGLARGDLRFPLIAKPRRGYGSRGVELLSDDDELARHLEATSDDDSVLGSFCYQNYLEGAEYTAELLFDDDGTLRDTLCTERILKQGRTVCCWPVFEPDLDAFLHAFAQETPAVSGPLNLQFRLNSAGEPTVFEINPRFSGSTSMRTDMGYNSPLRYMRHLLTGEPIEPATVAHRKVYRVFTEFSVPLDR